MAVCNYVRGKEKFLYVVFDLQVVAKMALGWRLV
jgi:hypothetical protein